MELQKVLKNIVPVSQEAMEQSKKRWGKIAKPLHSLGKLEDAVVQMAGIFGNAEYKLEKKGLVIFCADNGVVKEGVTQTGQEVTAIVAKNFTEHAASVCFMAEAAGVDVYPIDIGMISDVDGVTAPEYKVMYGTHNFAEEPAMSREEAERAILVGIQLVEKLAKDGYQILATGEMGIGNTTTSSAVLSVLLGKNPKEVTGRGAGLCNDGLERKVGAIQKGIELLKPNTKDPIDVLAKVGGLDIAGMTGMFLGAAIYRIPVVIDGLISSVAALCAISIIPEVKNYLLPSHRSAEPAGGMVLEALGYEPFLDCRMSLGEGSGAVAIFPLLDMALSVYHQMHTFEEIQVEQYEDFEQGEDRDESL